MRFEGVLQSWNDERGFGFIAPDAGGAQVFVHIKAFGPGAARPQLQQRLTYALETAPDGKLRASQVQPLNAQTRMANQEVAPGKRPSERFFHPPRQPLLLLLIPLLAVLLLVLGQLYTSTALPARWYVLMSALAFFLYAKDKKAARQGRWRTSENTLLSVGLLWLAGRAAGPANAAPQIEQAGLFAAVLAECGGQPGLALPALLTRRHALALAIFLRR